jgi:hypothetical protein
MKIGFDLDGTLDKPAIALLANSLLSAGHEVHIITGIFIESGDWQSKQAKFEKLKRIGIEFVDVDDYWPAKKLPGGQAILHCLFAVDASMGIDYRLRDLGLRKGALSEKLGLQIFLDDSETYMKMMPLMNGGITLLQVH